MKRQAPGSKKGQAEKLRPEKVPGKKDRCEKGTGNNDAQKSACGKPAENQGSPKKPAVGFLSTSATLRATN